MRCLQATIADRHPAIALPGVCPVRSGMRVGREQGEAIRLTSSVGRPIANNGCKAPASIPAPQARRCAETLLAHRGCGISCRLAAVLGDASVGVRVRTVLAFNGVGSRQVSAYTWSSRLRHGRCGGLLAALRGHAMAIGKLSDILGDIVSGPPFYRSGGSDASPKLGMSLPRPGATRGSECVPCCHSGVRVCLAIDGDRLGNHRQVAGRGDRK